jgi:hypothetical protein
MGPLRDETERPILSVGGRVRRLFVLVLIVEMLLLLLLGARLVVVVRLLKRLLLLLLLWVYWSAVQLVRLRRNRGERVVMILLCGSRHGAGWGGRAVLTKLAYGAGAPRIARQGHGGVVWDRAIGPSDG